MKREKFDDVVLAMLWHNQESAGSAWKGFDWDSLNRLHEKGLISNPVSKAKSVRLSEEGLLRGRTVFTEFFGSPEKSPT